MTNTNEKLRALFLAALMVVSVFGATAAFAGGAAAAASSATVQDDSVNVAPGDTVSVDVENDSAGDTTLYAVMSQNGTYESSDDPSGDVAATTGTDTVTIDSTGAEPGDYTVYVANESLTGVTDLTAWANVTASTQVHVINSSDVKSGDKNLDSQSTFWQGQDLFFKGNADNASTTFQLRNVDTDASDGVGTLVKEFTLDENAEKVFSTSNLDGEYVLVNEDQDPVNVNDGDFAGTDTNAQNVSFEVTVQSLDVAFADDSVKNGNIDNATDIEISSARSNFPLIVTWDTDADDDVSELKTAFETAFTTVEYYDTGDDETTSESNADALKISGVASDVDEEIQFSGVAAGDYDFTFAAEDTDAEDTASLTVSESGEGEVTFSQSSYAENRGDEVEMTVNLENANTGYVQIGSDSVNYNVTLEVTDGGDGEVAFTMNTYAAGWTNDTDAPNASTEDSVYELTSDSDDDDDTVDVYEVNAPSDSALDKPLEAGSYDLVAGTDLDNNGNIPGADETGVSSLEITERSTDAISTHTAPQGDSFSELSDIMSGDVTETSDIADGDKLIVKVDATGLYGQLSALEDLNGTTDGSTPSGLELWIEEADPGANQDADSWNMGGVSSSAELYTDADNDTFYVVTPTGNLSSDTEYTATFKLNESNPLVDDDTTNEEDKEEVSMDFSINDRDAEFDGLTTEDVLELEQTSETVVSGSSTLAPGSEVNIRLRGSGDTTMLKTVAVDIADDRTFEATFDLSDRSVGDEFTATVRSGGVISDEVDGVIVEEAPDVTTTEEPTTTTTEEPTTTTTTTEEPTTTTTEEPPTTTTTTSTPGFGIAVAMLALIGAALIALRRRD